MAQLPKTGPGTEAGFEATRAFEKLVVGLAAPRLYDRLQALMLVHEKPTADPRVVPYLLALMGDTTVCDLGRHRGIGELRVLAALALAAERRIRGVEEPVRIGSVPRPLSIPRITRLERENQVESEGEPIDRYVRLRAAGLVPIRELTV